MPGVLLRSLSLARWPLAPTNVHGPWLTLAPRFHLPPPLARTAGHAMAPLPTSPPSSSPPPPYHHHPSAPVLLFLFPPPPPHPPPHLPHLLVSVGADATRRSSTRWRRRGRWACGSSGTPPGAPSRPTSAPPGALRRGATPAPWAPARSRSREQPAWPRARASTAAEAPTGVPSSGSGGGRRPLLLSCGFGCEGGCQQPRLSSLADGRMGFKLKEFLQLD